MEETQVEQSYDLENTEEKNCEKIGKIWKKIVK